MESRTTTRSYSFEAGKKIGIKFRGGERQATPVGEQQVGAMPAHRTFDAHQQMVAHS